MKILKLIVELIIRVDINRDAPSIAPVMHTARCEDCGWTKDYATEQQAKRGLAAHYAHCPGPNELSEIWERMNGKR